MDVVTNSVADWLVSAAGGQGDASRVRWNVVGLENPDRLVGSPPPTSWDVMAMEAGRESYLLAGLGVPLRRPGRSMLVHCVHPSGDLEVIASGAGKEIERSCGGIRTGITVVDAEHDRLLSVLT